MKKLRKSLKIALCIIAGLVVLVPAVFLVAAYIQDIGPLSMEEIRSRSDILNNAAAVVVPHTRLDDGQTRAKHLKLFEKVERLVELTKEESAAYRTVYQDILYRHQSYLRGFDGNITVMSDVDMDIANNTGGTGIGGAHDHHDQSARSNAKDVIAALDEIASMPDGFFSLTKVRRATEAYKDLADILLHLGTAPQTKSTPYVPPVTITGKVHRLSEETLKNFKAAQFATVNSTEYWQAIHRALDHYDELVFEVQAQIHASLNPFERRLAGPWGGFQSVGPFFFNGYPEPRRPRNGPR